MNLLYSLYVYAIFMSKKFVDLMTFQVIQLEQWILLGSLYQNKPYEYNVQIS